jgi:hypothetical protein
MTFDKKELMSYLYMRMLATVLTYKSGKKGKKTVAMNQLKVGTKFGENLM